MDSQQTFSILLERLQYQASPNLILGNISSENVPEELEFSWREIKDKFQIDAVYFVANAPVIYFKCFEAFSEKLIADFHRKVWNQSQAPLIFVILPSDIRVYNGYAAPKNSSLTLVIEPSRLDHELGLYGDLWDRLEIFSRLAACRRERSNGHTSCSDSARILHGTGRSDSKEPTRRQNTVSDAVLFGLEGCCCPCATPKIRYGSV